MHWASAGEELHTNTVRNEAVHALQLGVVLIGELREAPLTQIPSVCLGT